PRLRVLGEGVEHGRIHLGGELRVEVAGGELRFELVPLLLERLDDGVGGDVQLAEHLEERYALGALRLLGLSRRGGHTGGVGGCVQAEARSSSEAGAASSPPSAGSPSGASAVVSPSPATRPSSGSASPSGLPPTSGLASGCVTGTAAFSASASTAAGASAGPPAASSSSPPTVSVSPEGSSISSPSGANSASMRRMIFCAVSLGSSVRRASSSAESSRTA